MKQKFRAEISRLRCALTNRRPPDRLGWKKVHPSNIPAPTNNDGQFCLKQHPPAAMSHCERASRPLLQYLRPTYKKGLPGHQLQSVRAFQSTAFARDGATTEEKRESFYKAPDPALVSSPKLERRLMRKGIMPIGSRRRRAALQGSANIPFEQLPYQCFQEARKVLAADREQKLKEIDSVRGKLARIQALNAEEAGGDRSRKTQLDSLRRYLERLKILADINDPLVKKKFEDGQGKNFSLFVYT